MKTNDEIKADISINQSKLLEEAERQATLFYEYSEQLGLAESEYKQKKDQLEYVWAEVSLTVREDRANAKIKLTESMLSSIVTLNPTVKRIKEEVIALAKKVNEFKAVQRALEHKKSMIELIGYKQGRQYNSEPEVYEERNYKS